MAILNTPSRYGFVVNKALRLFVDSFGELCPRCYRGRTTLSHEYFMYHRFDLRIDWPAYVKLQFCYVRRRRFKYATCDSDFKPPRTAPAHHQTAQAPPHLGELASHWKATMVAPVDERDSHA